MSDNEKPAVDQETPDPVDGNESADTQDGLDELLQEFEESAPAPKQETQAEAVSTPSDGETDQVLRDLKQFADETRQERKAQAEKDARESYRKDMDSLVSEIKGELEEDPEIVEGWILAKASKDPRVETAWKLRNDNPAAFKRIKAALTAEFASRKKVDVSETEDREAVAAAVRGAATRASETDDSPKFGGMTDTAAREEIEKRYGYTPSF